MKSIVFPFYSFLFFIICLPSTYLKMNLKWIHILLSLKLPRENDRHSTKETSELTRSGKQGPVLRERQVRIPGSSQFRRGNPKEH